MHLYARMDGLWSWPLAVSEPYTTALLLVLVGFLVAVSVLFSRTVEKMGVPIVLLFLLLGMLGGSEGIGKIAFEDYAFAARLGTVALALILFDGGLATSVAAVRQAIYPATVLATLGVAMTAGLVGLFARLVGLPWSVAFLLGAIVSSTDAAAVFAVLRGGRLALLPKVGRTLEVESCINDPMAVILTSSIIQMITANEPIGWKMAVNVPIQLAVGTGMGLMLGYVGRWVLQRIHLATVGLYPALTLATALISYGAATLVQGSGFLAVYVTGVVLGASTSLPYRAGLTRIHDAIAWLCQIGMFLMLGLLVFPSRLFPVAGIGLTIGLFLALVARPIAVILCLLPFRFTRKEVAYISWIGLRGAVPIILATFPVLERVPGADRIFDVVFFIVVISSIIPGTTVRWTTRLLGMAVPEKPAPPAVLEINSSYRLNGELVSFFIERSVAVCGAALKDIEFPEGAAVMMVIRGQDPIAARGSTVLEPGDHVYVFFRPEDRPFIELIFGRPEEGGSVATGE